MNKRLFVARLPWSIDDTSLRELFARYGEIVYAKIVVDRDTNRSKGFGFVEFREVQDAQNAMADMNGKDVEGRQIVVSVARPQAPRPVQR